MAKQAGPKLRIVASCADCVHEVSTHYAVQGDSGCNVRCAHPSFPEPKRIGDTTWDTPSWCPLYPSALEALLQRTRPA